MDRPDPLKSGPPPIPLPLVEWLEAVYPDRFPDLDKQAPPGELQRQYGRLEVIRLLRDHVTRQNQRPTRSPF